MAKSVASLAISVNARTRNFERGLKRAQSRLKRFSASLKAMSMRALKFGGALTAIAGGGGLVYLTRNAMKTIDATAKMADRFGMATEELTGLQHAARIMGSTTEGLNKGIEQLVRRIGEAQTGTGEAKDALDRLSLSAEHLARMSPAEAFRTIAEAIARLETHTQRADAAYRMFGRRGVELVNTLSLGRKGLDDMQREAEQLGLTFNRLDAAKVEAANDAFTRLKGAISGAAQVLTIEMAPYLQAFADRITESTKAGEGMGDKIVSALKWVSQAIAKATDWVDAFRSVWHLLRAGVSITAAGIIGALSGVARIIQELVNLLPGVDTAFSEHLWAVAEGFGQTAEEAFEKADRARHNFKTGFRSREVSKWFEDIQQKADEAAQDVADAANEQNSWTEAIDKTNDALAKTVQKLREALLSLRDRHWNRALSLIEQYVTTPLDRMNETIGEAYYLMEKGMLSMATYLKIKAGAQQEYLKRLVGGEGMSGMFTGDRTARAFFDPRQVAIGGAVQRARVQRVESAQLDKTNTLLDDIKDLLRQPAAGIVRVA